MDANLDALIAKLEALYEAHGDMDIDDLAQELEPWMLEPWMEDEEAE